MHVCRIHDSNILMLHMCITHKNVHGVQVPYAVGKADGQLPVQKTSYLLKHLLTGRRILFLPKIFFLQ